MELKLYDLFIDENLNDKSGVDDISVVDNPAIQENYMAFKTQKRVRIVCGGQKGNFTPIQGDKQILAGALMIPDMEIYRVDDVTGEEYNVRFKAEEIAKIQKKCKLLGMQNNINEMHNPNKRINNSVLFQDFIIDRKMGINPPLGQEHLPDGTWFGFVYVGDKMVWDEFIKTGIYRGYSVGGIFYEVEANDLTDTETNVIASAIS